MTTPPRIINTSGQTLIRMLPVELVLDILSLCETNSRLPAVCRTTATDFFRVGVQPHRVWSHRLVFLNPLCDPQCVRARGTLDGNRSHEMNSWARSVAQIESHVANYLKLHVPTTEGPFGFAGGMAPQAPVGNPESVAAEALGGLGLSTMMTAEFVDWLFRHAGSARVDWQTGLIRIRDKSMTEIFPPPVTVEDGALVDPLPLSAQSTRDILARSAVPMPDWRLLPDALLLVHFFIRTTQLNLLQLTLTRLQAHFPSLATEPAPFSLWSHFMLDNRPDLRFQLSSLTLSHDDPSMTYPQFLCFLSLLEWSKPTLDVVTHIFAQPFDSTAFANLVASHYDHDMFACLTTNLTLLTSPLSTSSRVLDILDWFTQHGAEINLDRFPLISPLITHSYPIFADVLLQHDVHNLCQAPNHTLADLGAKIADWVVAGHSYLVPVALEHELLSDQLLGKVLRQGVLKSDEGLVAAIASHCGRDLSLMQVTVVQALNMNEHSEPDPPAAYSTLFNMLYTHAIDPNAFLATYANHVPACALSGILFDCPSHGLLFSWNYRNHLRHQLEKAKSLSTIDLAWSVFMSRFIDAHLDAWIRSEQVDVGMVTLACAIRLIGFQFMRGVGGDLDRSTEAEYEQDVDRVTTLVSRTKDSLRKAVGALLCNMPLFYSSSLPNGAKKTLQEGITAAATMLTPIPPHSLDAAVLARSARARNFFLDTLLGLDRTFVLYSTPFESAATVYVWPRFQEHEIASRLTVDAALDMVQRMAKGKNGEVVAEIIRNLPRAIRDSQAFLLGVREMMGMEVSSGSERAMMLGLDSSRWEGWKEA